MEKQKINDRTKKGKGGYSNITVKKETTTRFRSYSKRFNKSHSEVLDGMVQYFKENDLDPFGEGTKIILDSIKKMERQMMKKFDRLIAIIKNMEKTSIRPTYEMMLILYEAYVKDGRKPRRDPVQIQKERMDFLEPRNTVPKTEHDRMLQEFKEYKKHCLEIINNVEKVEPMMGKPYLKINMGIGDFESLKHRLK
ncbi:BfmA/BtgA family mobilization protein [Maribacter sp. PR1]|uniref:BfmA/BtgA family mobilization protein n=1 Tax=Maribacter cobaltidurans TaxID=1178778 RepID=A0ABU7J012_9FLAO|nr:MULTISPECIES: BfmA/BtgA family mobilization protein [Maribacter]MDC6390979.1 BfmA/BtgA family mobilization protein [Maribacter sp. PR1]MEE1978371.1 BfmA/BtgA family mobilization protein [Maribacter cobaltidurans]